MKLRITPVVWLCLLSLSLGCDDNQNHPGQSRYSPTPPGKIGSWPLAASLPLVVLDTSGQRIQDEPKIPARLTLIQDPAGGTNYLGSPHIAFQGAIKIEIRGKTSQQYPKKQYSFKLQQEAALLDFPAATDWILYGPYTDKTLMRDFLAYEFSNRMGRWATGTRFVEVILNDTGASEAEPRHYSGVYLLMERIERGPNRVRIGYDTSGGDVEDDPVFLLKIDKMDQGDRVFRTPHGTQIIHVYPSGGQRNRSAEKFMSTFEAALSGDDFEDPDQGYRKFIDVDSFVDYFILNELFKNIDAYRLSAYFHKDRGGKLRMGPVWDFNLSLGNADYYSGWKTRGWLVNQSPAAEGFPVPFWWSRLLESDPFRHRIAARWRECREKLLSNAELIDAIDQTVVHLADAPQRNFQKWPVLGRYVWPNPSPLPKTYPEEISRLKSWVSDRANWMDQELQSF